MRVLLQLPGLNLSLFFDELERSLEQGGWDAVQTTLPETHRLYEVLDGPGDLLTWALRLPEGSRLLQPRLTAQEAVVRLRKLVAIRGDPVEYPRFIGRRIRLNRDEAEFLVDQCERDRIPQYMALGAQIREAFGMGPFPAGAS